MSSPSYPSKYPDNVDCEWTIKFPKGEKIVLNFMEFNLESHANCTYDWLEVRDGGASNSPLIGRKLCGTKLPKRITSKRNYLFAKFHSDSSSVRAGFRIQVDKPGVSFQASKPMLTLYLYMGILEWP